MKDVLCKAVCLSEKRVVNNGVPGGFYYTYEFSAVYSQDPNHENKKYWDATPQMSVSMTVKEQLFIPGLQYYLSFSLNHPALGDLTVPEVTYED